MITWAENDLYWCKIKVHGRTVMGFAPTRKEAIDYALELVDEYLG
jgi:hypothetical protein